MILFLLTCTHTQLFLKHSPKNINTLYCVFKGFPVNWTFMFDLIYFKLIPSDQGLSLQHFIDLKSVYIWFKVELKCFFLFMNRRKTELHYCAQYMLRAYALSYT